MIKAWIARDKAISARKARGSEMSYQYIEFILREYKNRTNVWSCKNIRHDAELGTIKWNSQWRQYCYFPTVQAVYSASCLEDIANFIKTEMEARK